MKRLYETYGIGTMVEILLPARTGEEEAMGWIPGLVAAHDPPGIWVRTGDDDLWFVTNTRHIRHGAREDPGATAH